VEVVRGFLDALGVPGDRVPPGLAAQAGLYRSLVSGRRMLIVLDNARDTSHVTPLLPGSPSCTVLVTSRDRMPGLVTAHGAHPLPLDMLPEPDARGLLARRLGQTRLDAEPDAITELLTYCAGLPLALGVVAARAATHPNFPLAMLATELRDRATRLDALDQGDPAASLTTVLSWSYHALEPEQAEVFRLLGLTPGQDISLPAAASLTGLPATQTSAVLRMLERVSLVHEHAPERWWMHDLVKLYAADQAHHDQLVDRREGALRRLVDHYTHTAFTGDRLLNPHRPTIVLDPHAPGSHPHPLPDPTTALGWFEAEHSNLLAIQQAMVERGWHRAVWLLAWTLHSFQYRQGHGHDEVTVWRAGVAAAEHLADPATQILARRRLGGACARLGRHDEAVEHLHHALTLAEHTDDLPDQTHTHHALAWAWGWRGENRRALEHAGHALRLSQALDNPEWEADALNTVGWLSARLGEYNQARTHCQAALDLCRRHHYRDGEASTLDSLGYIAFHTGQHADAVRYYQQALTLYRDLDNTYEEAETLDRLGHAYAAEGQHGQAHHAWQQALELYHAQHRSEEAARIQQQLNTLRVPNKVVRRAAR
jgi:tetratricopeptide (TPR) repeat protein